MSTVGATSPRPRHLRVVRPTERTRHRARADARSRRIVTLLLGTTAFLVATGLVMVLSASSVTAFADHGDSFMFVQRQAVYAVIGVLALVVTSRLRYDAWKRLALPLLILTLVMLVVVLHPASGIEAYGSSRWFRLGPVTVQPSELAKFTVVVFTANVFTRKWGKLDDLGHLAMPMLPVTAIVCGSVMLQPDLGTTVIIAGTVFLVMFVAGVRMRYLTIAGIVGAVIAAGLIMSADYRRIRFLSFLDPWDDAQNTGYQLIQSLIALGSGGFTGVGLGVSRQKWEYVPNAHTDFIFSILGEELGLLGEIVVLLAFGALLYAGIAIATRTNDVFGRLLASGIAAWFGLQTLVNLGAVTGLLPVTGVPLPFLSYGGSSLVVLLAAVGVLVSIARAPMRGGPGAGGRRPSSGRSRAGAAAGRTSTAASARSGRAR